MGMHTAAVNLTIRRVHVMLTYKLQRYSSTQGTKIRETVGHKLRRWSSTQSS